jgi:hypothetical protein
VLAAEHLLDFAGLHFLRERVEGLGELGVDGFARLRPLDEDGEVVAFPGQRCDEVAVLLETTAALEDFLRLGLILPEIGSRRARLEASQLFVGM